MEIKPKINYAALGDGLAVLLAAFIVLLMVTGFAPRSGRFSNELPLDQNDSLYFERKTDFKARLLTYLPQPGDSLHLSLIDLDKYSRRTIYEAVARSEDKVELKVSDFLEHIPFHSFLVVKINSTYFYKDVYVKKDRGF